MSEDLRTIETWIGGVLLKLEPAQRRKLAQTIALDLKRDQVDRIAAQKNPDGSAFAARKKRPALRGKSGRIKRRAAAMFRKLRGPSFLRHEASAEEVAVGFFNAQVARIAGVHQRGLRDRVSRSPDAPEVDYPARQLLGFTDDWRERLADLVLKHVVD